MKNTVYAAVLLFLLTTPVHAETAQPDQPNWALEIKGGMFVPALENWSRYYGDRDMTTFGLSLAYRLSRQVQVGGGISRMEASGTTQQERHQTPSPDGQVRYELIPVELFVVLRGIRNEDQLVVPYVGAGYSRFYYRQTMEPDRTARGAVGGYQYRAGLQFSLNNMDPGAGDAMYRDYGIFHTYFFIEAQRSRAIEPETSTDLGGTAIQGGLVFEF